jgi:hypothetical protein
LNISCARNQIHLNLGSENNAGVEFVEQHRDRCLQSPRIVATASIPHLVQNDYAFYYVARGNILNCLFRFKDFYKFEQRRKLINFQSQSKLMFLMFLVCSLSEIAKVEKRNMYSTNVERDGINVYFRSLFIVNLYGIKNTGSFYFVSSAKNY